jgi:hypothetical protein
MRLRGPGGRRLCAAGKSRKFSARRVDTTGRDFQTTALRRQPEEFTMKVRARLIAIALVVATGAVTQSGCFWITSAGPNLGPLAFPIPVPVGIQKAKEDQFWNYERYERAPILGPIPPGGP